MSFATIFYQHTLVLCMLTTAICVTTVAQASGVGQEHLWYGSTAVSHLTTCTKSRAMTSQVGCWVVCSVCAAGQQPGGGAALARRGLLNVPKLLDVAVLYGADNPALTQQLLAEVRMRSM